MYKFGENLQNKTDPLLKNLQIKTDPLLTITLFRLCVEGVSKDTKELLT